MLARLREPFAIPSEASPRAALWIAAFRALTLLPLAFGREHHFETTRNGRSIRIVCVGFGRRFDDLIAGLFGTVVPVGGGPLRPAWRHAPLSRLDADLIVVDVHRVFVDAFRRAGWLIVPEDVRWQADPACVPPATPSESLRADMRKIERFGYTLEEAGTAADWSEFFEAMVIPHLTARFGAAARLPSRRAKRIPRRRARLFFLRREDVRVAGGCLMSTPRGVLLRRIGIRDGDANLLREGVFGALYLLLFDWTRARGYREFDSGTTLPLPQSGLARFKAKLGLQPVPNPIALTAALRFDPENPALVASFQRCPVFHEVDGRIETYP